MKRLLKPLALIPIAFTLTRASLIIRDASLAAQKAASPDGAEFPLLVLSRCGMDLVVFLAGMSLFLCAIWFILRLGLLADEMHDEDERRRWRERAK